MSIQAYVIKGKARYAKVVGKAPPGYDNGPAEWTFDLVVDAENQAKAIKNGMDKFYVKEKDGLKYIRFSRKALKQDGTEAKPFDIVDAYGNDWDGKTLIGNDSELHVQFCLNEVKSKGQKRMKPSALKIMVWDLVKYKPKSPFETKEAPPAEVEAEGGQAQDW